MPVREHQLTKPNHKEEPMKLTCALSASACPTTGAGTTMPHGYRLGTRQEDAKARLLVDERDVLREAAQVCKDLDGEGKQASLRGRVCRDYRRFGCANECSLGEQP